MANEILTKKSEVGNANSAQSFWEIGNYRKVVKRVDDSAKICFELLKMVHERSEIEAKYSKSLQQWSKKWEDCINKGPEYGTLENGWKAILIEGKRQGDLHNELNKKLNQLANNISEWRVSNYHKAIAGQWKEVKQVEEGFSKAQKPWEKILSRCNKAKKMYYQSAQELESTKISLGHLESTTSGDLNLEHLSKLREKKERLEKERDKNKEKYQGLITELFLDKPRYTESMQNEFEKSQIFEKKRMEFFKETFHKMKDIIDLSNDERIPCIYQVCEHTLSQINPDSDLEWYLINHGPPMAYNWPEYEEYKESVIDKTESEGSELSSVTDDRSSSIHSSPCRIPREPIIIITSDEAISSNASTISGTETLSGTETSLGTEGTTIEGSERSTIKAPLSTTSSSTTTTTATTTGIETLSVGCAMHENNSLIDHVYESADDIFTDEQKSQLKDGVLMKALYDYEGIKEDDDLSFNEGDVVCVLEFCEGGWAKAVLRDEYGYVPVSYLEHL